jgi:5-formyltetrahydrofolate cyclo-ligase
MTGSAESAKHELRTQLLARRAALAPAQVRVWSQALTEHLLAHPIWSEARAIAAFVGVRNEVDTRLVIERSLAAGKRVWLPRLTGRGIMRFWPCARLDELEPGRMGLREPRLVGPGLATPTPADGVDLILVPGLGFGRDGSRIGFGAGYYDRALGLGSGARSLRCGVCFGAFVDPPEGRIPMLTHDLRVDWLATEDGLIKVPA